jgi:hypothetical protein
MPSHFPKRVARPLFVAALALNWACTHRHLRITTSTIVRPRAWDKRDGWWSGAEVESLPSRGWRR